MCLPTFGLSEDVVSTPDGGLISNVLVEAKNATKTAKKFFWRCAVPLRNSPSSFPLTVEHPIGLIAPSLVLVG